MVQGTQHRQLVRSNAQQRMAIESSTPWVLGLHVVMRNFHTVNPSERMPTILHEL